MRFQVYLLTLLLSLIAIGCGREGPQQSKGNNQADGKKRPRPVKTSSVVEMPMTEKVTVMGTLVAYDQATLSNKVAGRVATIHVDLGSQVKAGQVVARIEQRDYELRVQQAEAALTQARVRLGLSPKGGDERVNPEQTGTVRQARAQMEEARLNRSRSATLVEQGVISRAEFDSVEATYKVTVSRYQDAIEEIRNREGLLSQRKSELALARQQLSDTVIRAPFAGMVQEKTASIGEYLAAGSPVINIVKVNPLRFRAEVPEREAKDIRQGQQVRISAEGAPKDHIGLVTRISPVITEQNRILIVEADIVNDGTLRPGAFVRAELTSDDIGMVAAVPSGAIISFAGIQKVILAKEGKAVESPVTVGRRNPEWTEIVAGVKLGDQVIVNPGNLQSGDPLVVVQ
jgi:RND family efflux transporter MFP subunit